jgi:tetratricopeptide (TPR) repeat protein
MSKKTEIQQIYKKVAFILGHRHDTDIVLMAASSVQAQQKRIEEFQQHLPKFTHHIWQIKQPYESLYFAAKELFIPLAKVENGEYKSIVHIVGLHNYLLEARISESTGEVELVPSLLASSLNMERESFFRNLPFLIVIWLSEDYMIHLRKAAPDFASWVSNIFVLEDDEKDVFLVDEVELQKIRNEKDEFFNRFLIPNSIFPEERKIIEKNIFSWKETLQSINNQDKNKIQQKIAESELYQLIADGYYYLKDFIQAEDNLKLALERIKGLPSEKNRYNVLNNLLVLVLIKNNKIDEATQKIILLIEDKSLDKEAKIKLHTFYGDIKFNTNLFDEALSYYINALKMCEEISNSNKINTLLGEVIIYEKIANIYKIKFEYSISRFYYLISINRLMEFLNQSNDSNYYPLLISKTIKFAIFYKTKLSDENEAINYLKMAYDFSNNFNIKEVSLKFKSMIFTLLKEWGLDPNKFLEEIQNETTNNSTHE